MNTPQGYLDMKNQLSYHKNLYYHKHFLSDFVFWSWKEWCELNYHTALRFL